MFAATTVRSCVHSLVWKKKEFDVSCNSLLQLLRYYYDCSDQVPTE